MDIPIEISFDSEKPKRRAPPARFAAMMKQKEETVDPPKPVKENGNVKHYQVRPLKSPICKDNPNPCSIEEAISILTNLYPEFPSKKEIIDSEPKWQEKVKAMSDIAQFIRDNAKGKFEYSEPSIVYALSFSKEFKAANMNIVKSSFDCVRSVIETCGIGPRVGDRVISSLISKIHDRKLGSDASDLILLIGEYAGPNTIISAIRKGMSKSKIPLQQKAALTILSRVVNEFGSYSLDVKSLFSYLQTDQGILNSHVDVKNQTIAVLCSLHQQIGSVILQLLENSGINELLLKSIKESFESAPFDASLASKYAAVAPSSQASETPKPVFSVDDLITAADLSTELPPLLKLVNHTEGKESWKQRQQGLNDIQMLLKQKQRVVNNRVISDLVTSLKNRLTESHLMLKAKVLQCIAQLAEAIGDEIIHYNPVLMSELMKLSNESNKTVVESLYQALTSWVGHSKQSTATNFQSICSYLPSAFKSVKGRLAFLHWLNTFLSFGEKRGLMSLLPGCIDCVLDKTKEVRTEAIAAVKTIGLKCGRFALEDEIKKRKHSDVLSLQSSLQLILETLSDHGESTGTAPVAAIPAEKVNKEEKSKLTEARIQSLANRPGARVLGKRTTSLAATLKRQAVSSIPKPQPPLKKRMEVSQEAVQAVHPDPADPVDPANSADPADPADPMNAIQSENSGEHKESEVMLPSPTMSCLSVNPVLIESRENLLSQKELLQCSVNLICPQLPSYQFVSTVLSCFAHFESTLSHHSLMVLSEQANREYNQFIEMTTQLCWLFNQNIQVYKSEEFLEFSRTVSPSAIQEVKSFMDTVLRLLTGILSHILSAMNRGMQMDSLILVHIVNTLSVLFEGASTCFIQPETVSVLLLTLIQAICTIPQDVQFNESQSLKTMFHKLLRLSIDQLPLPSLLEGICLFLCEINSSISEETVLLVLMKRYFSNLLTRINSTQMDDRMKMECVAKMKSKIPSNLNSSLRCEIDRCIHVLEPIQVTSTSFGEVLKSANQMLTSQSVSSNLTTTSMLKSQMESFKQRYMANRQNLETIEKKEDKVELVDTPTLSDKEQEQEDRMNRIRDLINQRHMTK